MKHLTFLNWFIVAFLTTSAQHPMLIPDTKSSGMILTGKCTKADLVNPELHFWDAEILSAYHPSDEAIRRLMAIGNDWTVTLILGTWCGDSREHVPVFLHILETIGFPDDKMTIIGVDRNKKAGELQLETLNITRVPTFIFYRNGTEVGSIIETPEKTIEEDMVSILTR